MHKERPMDTPSEIATLPDYWKKIFNKMPEYVTRKELSAFSGGMFAPETIANRDSQGTGPAKRRRMGKRVVYHKKDAVLWLHSQDRES